MYEILSPSFLVNKYTCTVKDNIILSNGTEVTVLVPLLKSDDKETSIQKSVVIVDENSYIQSGNTSDCSP